MDNRPEGRKKRIEGAGGGLYRRGEGQNTGPVGSGGPGPGNGGAQRGGTPFVQTGGGGNYRGRRGGKSPLVAVVALLLVLLAKGVFSPPSGEVDTVEPTPQTVIVTPRPTARPKPASTPRPAAKPKPAASVGAASSTQASWTEPANVGSLSDDVANGAREKFTKLRGKGRDSVTVMVYMCGTDLESRGGMATKDLLEMTRAKLSDKVRVVVYTGGCTKWNNNVVNERQNQVYEVSGGSLKTLDSDAGNVSMTDPNTLADFIRFCAKNYAADRYELILWDHGGGSVSGFGHDQKFSASGSMTLSGIKKAIDAGGVDFDFVGFDACLMGTLETGLMLSEHADYLIASEETEPGTGWYYTNWLTKLSSNSSMPTTELGRLIVDDFVSACAQGAPGQAATLSVVDLAELSYTVPPVFRAFSESLSGMIADKEYKQISTARSNTREFARSTQIDQIDLVHFASNLGTAEGKALSKAVLGAVKYNRSSSGINNAYGVSIYFPYRKLSNVDKAIRTYDAIGLDESYSQCIREFASLETAGQAAAGGTGSPYPSLFGDLYGGSGGSGGSYVSGDSAELINALLSSFFGGDGTLSGFTGGSTDYLGGRAMSTEDAAAYIAANRFDPGALVWTPGADGEQVLVLPEEQWSLVNALDLSVFYDDGEGYLDLGLDNTFDWDANGDLLAPQERTWIGINGQIVAYYHEYTTGSGDELVITGYVPVLLNGERAELLLSFDSASVGTVVGARYVYRNGETDTVAKSLETLTDGDTLDFLCDYYRYDGSYDDSYLIGEQMTVDGELHVADLYLPEGGTLLSYRFTDLYGQHYWSQPLAS